VEKDIAELASLSTISQDCNYMPAEAHLDDQESDLTTPEMHYSSSLNSTDEAHKKQQQAEKFI